MIDALIGEVKKAQLFVAVLGASSLTFAEATWTQTLPDWIGSHTRAFAFFGGVAAMTVSDNLKSGVIKACFYEPAVNRSYAEMAAHYDTAIVPARPYKPRDKAKVEVGVQVATRWIIAKLRKRQFFSLSELNAAIAIEVAALNARVTRHLGASRRALFEELEREALKQLPAEPYVYAEWKECRVGLDYHVEVKKHYYSVPYPLLRETVWARITARTVEVFHRGKRVAAHVRSSSNRKHTTVREHMPSSHRRFADWTPESLMRRADEIGRNTSALIEVILREKHASRAGLPRLRRHPAPRQELWRRAAWKPPASRALEIGARSYSSVNSILKNNLDRQRPATAHGRAGDIPRQHPWPWLLPLRKGRSMLTHPTLDQLRALEARRHGRSLRRTASAGQARDLAHAEWLALLLDREAANRDTRRFRTRLRAAKLRHGQAAIEDVDYRTPRRLDKALFQQLATVPLDRRAPQFAGHRQMRRRQVVVVVRAGAEGLPRWLHRTLRARAPPVRRTRAGPRRRPLRAAVPHAHQGRSADPRRLGTGSPHRQPAARSDGDRRGSPRPRLHADHQPTPRG